MRHLSIDLGRDGFAVLTMDNADESTNLVSESWLTEMDQAIGELTKNEAVRGVILTSSKKTFLAGADLKLLVEGYGKLTKRQAFDFSQRATRMHRAIETGGKPWAAVLNGVALGGGFELALAAHYRIVVDDPKAVLGLPEVNLGLLPGSGGTQRLLRLAGVKTALDLLLSGRAIKPDEALKLGIIDEVVPAGSLMERARAWLASAPDAVKPWDKKGFTLPETRGLLNPETAAMFSAASGSISKQGRYLKSPAAILSTVFEGVQLPFDKALAVESKYFANLLTDPVARNIIRSTFLSKAAAEKGARRPTGVARSVAKKVGVLGAGMMGAGIALVSATAGIDVVLIDLDQKTAEAGRAHAAGVLDRDVKQGRRTRADADAILARIIPTDTFGRLEGCDMVVEAVFEDTAIKAETMRKAESVIPAAAIFATNTSTLPITQLAKASARPEHFIGLHFFSPVERMGLVEIIMGKQTSRETLAKGIDFVAQLRKTPIVVNDSRGFYTSRVFQTMIHEGAAMLAEGMPPAVIENAAKAGGFPVGPLALLDELSFDLPLKIVDQAIAEEGDKYTPPAGVVVLRRMRDELCRSGRKAGGGFYDYPTGGKKTLWPGLAQVFPPRTSYDIEELTRRLFYTQALEAARCLEEGVIETVEDADLGAIYGWGFPAWTGGTISYIDTIGIEAFMREADRLAQLYGSRFAPSPWLRAKSARGESFYHAAKVSG